MAYDYHQRKVLATDFGRTQELNLRPQTKCQLMDLLSIIQQYISKITASILCIIIITALHRISNTSNDKLDGTDNNGCNDPNCIRCHSRSTRHMEAFQRNATLLRRLVKLEPEMFEGMRCDVWTAIEEMEQQAVRTRLNIFSSMMNYLAGLSNSQTSSSISTMIPLSPQPGQQPTVFFVPNLEAVPFHHRPPNCHSSCPCKRLWMRIPIDPKSPPIPTTGDIEMLQQNFKIIQAELNNVLSSEEEHFAPFDAKVYTSTNHKQTPQWSSIYLYHQGMKQSACNLFPRTTHIIETLCPNRMAGKCGLGSIYFSKLKSHTKVNEHYGPTNVRWRCHLPLIVPKSNTGSCLCVGVGDKEEKMGWEEGRPMLFDDSFLHSAVHFGSVGSEDDDDARIVLIIDFWHPALSEGDRNAIGVLYPPGS